MSGPFRLTFNMVGPVDAQKLLENVTVNTALMRMLDVKPPHGRKLAIVGGGNSAKSALDELRSWPGDIWAINATASWLAKNGIKAKLFTVDPIEPTTSADGVEEAILSTSCSPDLVRAIPKVYGFHTHGMDPTGLFCSGGSSSAGIAAGLALKQGHRQMHYFGCEGSWDMGGWSHSDRDDRGQQLIIRAGGRDYITNPQMMLQCEQLSHTMSALPDMLIDRSGGLLRAMIEHLHTWEVVALSDELKKLLDPDGEIVPYQLKAAA